MLAPTRPAWSGWPRTTPDCPIRRLRSAALADARRFNTGVASPVFVGVNVSATQLRRGFTDTARAWLAASGVDPSLLVMEITESLLLKEDERAWSYLSDLRSDGIRVAIDELRHRYASLELPRQPSIDIVKIDASFLRETTSTRSRLLEAVITLTARLSSTRSRRASRIEATRDLLVELGCGYGQGFYAEPMPIEAAGLAGSAGTGQPTVTGSGRSGLVADPHLDEVKRLATDERVRRGAWMWSHGHRDRADSRRHHPDRHRASRQRSGPARPGRGVVGLQPGAAACIAGDVARSGPVLVTVSGIVPVRQTPAPRRNAAGPPRPTSRTWPGRRSARPTGRRRSRSRGRSCPG